MDTLFKILEERWLKNLKYLKEEKNLFDIYTYPFLPLNYIIF